MINLALNLIVQVKIHHFYLHQMRVVDKDGKILSVGKEGAVEVKSPWMFSGYRDMPEATMEAFTQDGFFKTK